MRVSSGPRQPLRLALNFEKACASEAVKAFLEEQGVSDVP